MDINASVSDGTVSSVANLATQVLKFFGPKETETVSLDYEHDAKARIQQQEDILSQPDSISRAGELASFYSKLCIDTGHPAGGLSGKYIPIPVEVLRSLGLGSIDDIRAGKYLAGALRSANNS